VKPAISRKKGTTKYTKYTKAPRQEQPLAEGAGGARRRADGRSNSSGLAFAGRPLRHGRRLRPFVYFVYFVVPNERPPRPCGRGGRADQASQTIIRVRTGPSRARLQRGSISPV